MNAITYPIGHPTLRAADISPSKSASFSPNLHKYLKAHGHFYKDGGLLDGVFVATTGTAAQWFGAGALVLGYVDEEFFTGTRLMSALCHGSKAERAAYPCLNGLDLVEGFWDAYLKVGRCAIDPAHKECFLGSRYSMVNNIRTCLWCGAQHERVVTPRTVFDESWNSL